MMMKNIRRLRICEKSSLQFPNQFFGLLSRISGIFGYKKFLAQYIGFSDVTRTSRDGVITCIYPTVTGTEEQLTFQLSCELPKVVENASFDRRRILVFECQLFVFLKKSYFNEEHCQRGREVSGLKR